MEQEKIVAETAGIAIPASPYSLRRGFQRRLRQAGGYEADEIACAIALLRAGDRILELGAGLGVVSAALAKTGLAARVRSYEANPELIKHIERLYAVNDVVDRIELHNAIVLSSDGPATVPFYVASRFAYSSLVKPAKFFSREVRVPTKQFCDIVRDFRPNILVLDIEGGELDFLESADLTGIHGICIEFHPGVYDVSGMRACKRLLTRSGFSPMEGVSTRTVWAARRD